MKTQHSFCIFHSATIVLPSLFRNDNHANTGLAVIVTFIYLGFTAHCRVRQLDGILAFMKMCCAVVSEAYIIQRVETPRTVHCLRSICTYF